MQFSLIFVKEPIKKVLEQLKKQWKKSKKQSTSRLFLNSRIISATCRNAYKSKDYPKHMPGQYIPSDDLLNEIHKLNPEIEPKDVAETYQRKISERLLPVEQCGKRRISDSGEIIL